MGFQGRCQWNEESGLVPRILARSLSMDILTTRVVEVFYSDFASLEVCVVPRNQSLGNESRFFLDEAGLNSLYHRSLESRQEMILGT